MTIRNSVTFLTIVILGGCGGFPRERPHAVSAADSVVLERSLCFGTCPAYRLRISDQGEVHFQSRNRGDTSRTATDTIDVREYRSLLYEADRIGFNAFPSNVISSSELCPVQATDHPTITLSIFRTRGVKRIEYYTGCYTAGEPHRPVPELLPLKTLAASVDSVARAARWIRPAWSR